MDTDLSKVDILTRREIEARMVGPLIKAFMREFGKEKTLEIAEGVIKSLARESGVQLATHVEGDSIEHFAKGLVLWTKNDALQIEVLEQDETKFSFNVLRCRYAEMYKDIGMLEFGNLFSCSRDFAMGEGFNPKLKLSRTKTIMEGKDYCDFRYKMEEDI